MKIRKNTIKNQKAITLIALVITIIILLILAGVTIGFAMNGTGLFDKAKLATDEYNNKVQQEETELDKASNEVEQYIDATRTISEQDYQRLKTEIKEELKNEMGISVYDKKIVKSGTVTTSVDKELTSMDLVPGTYLLYAKFGAYGSSTHVWCNIGTAPGNHAEIASACCNSYASLIYAVGTYTTTENTTVYLNYWSSNAPNAYEAEFTAIKLS